MQKKTGAGLKIMHIDPVWFVYVLHILNENFYIIEYEIIIIKKKKSYCIAGIFTRNAKNLVPTEQKRSKSIKMQKQQNCLYIFQYSKCARNNRFLVAIQTRGEHSFYLELNEVIALI